MRTLLFIAVAVAVAAPAAAAGPTGGEIRADGASVVVTPAPPGPGQTVQVPEGWYRVESAGDEDEDEGGATGSLTVLAGEVLALAAPAPAPPAPPQPPVALATRDPFERSCGELRDAYLKQLLRMAGITSVDRPAAFLRNLQGGDQGALSPWVRFNMFGLPLAGPWGANVAGVPVLQPLAWDFELQRIAAELERCSESERTP